MWLASMAPQPSLGPPGRQPLEMSDGTPVLMPVNLSTSAEMHIIYLYAGQLDPIDRVPPMDDLDVDSRDPAEDFATNFAVYNAEAVEHFRKESLRLRAATDKAIILAFGGGGFGDAGVLPGPYELHPKGVRRFADWMMAHYLYPDYVKGVIEAQKRVALENLALLKGAIEDRIDVINISCTDFGSQAGMLISRTLQGVLQRGIC